MELLPSGHELQDDGDFLADHLDPFPEPPASFINNRDSNPADAIQSAAAFRHRPKLRPIRCASRPAPVSGNVGVGLLLLGGCGGSRSKGASSELKVAAAATEVAASGEEGSGVGSGFNGSESGEGIGDPNCEGRACEAETSSSDKGDDSSADTREPDTHKRRIKKRRKLEHIIETMVKKVMERQEQMHKEVLEMIEKSDRERMRREEAWHQQEMERMKKMEELRAEETARSLNLISFIQKLTGQVSSPLNAPSPVENDGQIQRPDVVSNPSSAAKSDAQIQSLKDTKCDWDRVSDNRRWLESEVRALITFRTTLDQKFQTVLPKGSIWDEIALKMSNLGYKRSARKCREKWENVNKYFKRLIAKGNKRPEKSKACSYFRELSVFYGTRIINMGNSIDNVNHEQANQLPSTEELESGPKACNGTSDLSCDDGVEV